MAIALGTLEYVLEEGSRWNWFDDATIRTCAWIAAIAGILFVIRSLTFARPVVDLRALTNRNFALGCFLSFVTGIGIFSTIYLTPLFLGYVRGFSAWQTGVAIFSTGAASLVGVPVYILLAQQIRHALADDVRPRLCSALAMWSYSFITHDWGGDELLLPQILRGFPQVFAVAPAVTLGPRQPAAGAAQIRERPVQHDAQSRRRRRHRGLRRDPQRPHQFPFRSRSPRI